MSGPPSVSAPFPEASQHWFYHSEWKWQGDFTSNTCFSQPKFKLYGLYWALCTQKIHLVGIQNFIVEVDTKYIKGMLANPDIVPSASINHWILSILMFHFTLVHVPSTHHGPDKLSRWHPQPGDKPEPKDDYEDWIDNVNGLMHIINSIMPCTNTITDLLPVIMYINEPVSEGTPEPEEWSEKQLEQYDLVLHSEKAQKADDRLELVQNWLETLQQPDRMLDPEYKMFMWYCMEFFENFGAKTQKDNTKWLWQRSDGCFSWQWHITTLDIMDFMLQMHYSQNNTGGCICLKI